MLDLLGLLRFVLPFRLLLTVTVPGSFMLEVLLLRLLEALPLFMLRMALAVILKG